MSTERPESYTRVYLAMLATILIWAFNYVFAKVALEYIDPMAFNALRYLVAASIVVSWWRWQGESEKLSKCDFWLMLGIGLWGYGLYQIFFIVGLKFTTAGNSALFGATAPLWTALLGLFLGRERLSALSWVGIVLALVGVSTVILGGQAHVSLNPSQILGDLLIIVSTMIWASFTVMSKAPLARHSYTQFVALGISAGAILLLIAGAPALVSLDWAGVPWWVYLVIFFSGALSNAAAYLMWANAVAKVGPARTSIFLNLNPVLTLILGVVTLNEPIVLLQIIGAMAVLLGVWWTTRS